jgi:ligand-binding SRPBCC domain-containing protein
MIFHYETWSNKPANELTDYFLDYSNINFFTPFWMKFSVIESNKNEVIFKVVTPISKFKWKSLIERTQFGFIDRLQNGPFYSFTHKHEFIPFHAGTIIKDSLNIELTRFKLLNTIIHPILKIFLNLAFKDRELKSYQLLFNPISLHKYTAIEKRIEEALSLYDSSGFKYIKLYAFATRLLNKYQRILPSEYDLINNEVYNGIIENKSNAKTQLEQLDYYLYWEKKTIVSPLLSILLKKKHLKRFLSRFCIFISFKDKLFFVSKSFNQEETRIKLTKLLFNKMS